MTVELPTPRDASAGSLLRSRFSGCAPQNSKYNSITPISHFTARRWTTSDSRGLTCTHKWLEVGKSILWNWKMWSMSIMSGGKSYTPSVLLGFEYSRVTTMKTELWWESCYDPLPSISRSSNVSFRIILSTQLVADSKIAKSKNIADYEKSIFSRSNVTL